MSCPRNSQLTHTKERPVRTAGKIQKSPAGCADRCSSNNCVPASVGAAFIGVQRGHPLPHFPLPLPLSLEGFPKGRAAARPFVSFQGGAGGNRNPPAFLFRGPGGHSLFQKRISPWLLRTETVQFRREFRPHVGASHHTGSPYSAQVLLSVTFTSMNCPISSLPPFRRTSRLPSVREERGKFSSSLSPSTSTRTVLPT